MLSQEGIIIENFFFIPNKKGDDVPFALNEAQRRYDSDKSRYDLIPKARQEGVSSYKLAELAVKCLHKRNTRAVVISHDQESTERLFKRVHYFINNFRGSRRPKIQGKGSKRELEFPNTGSTFYIGTAGSRKFGRGDTISDLHASEAAFWENPKDLFSGLSDAVPVDTGTITLESTGNGHNWYYQRIQDVLDGRSHYKIHFFNWQSFPEYDMEVTEEEEKHILDTLNPEYEEDTLFQEGSLTVGQLKFRRIKLAEKDWDLQLFKQEYPMSLDECFQTTSTGLFGNVRYAPRSPYWKCAYRTGTETFYADNRHPMTGMHYVIGHDPSEGVGNDNAVMQIICLESEQQVGEWISGHLEQDVQGKRVAALGKEYNDAFIVVERNKGQVAIKVLRDSGYPSNLLYRDKPSPSNPLASMGFNTTSATKPMIIGLLRMYLRDSITIFSEGLKSELDTFKEHPSGKLEAEEGCKDDRVMAMAMCIAGFQKAAVYMGDYTKTTKSNIEVIDPFSLDSIVREMSNKRNGGFPIKRQARLVS